MLLLSQSHHTTNPYPISSLPNYMKRNTEIEKDYIKNNNDKQNKKEEEDKTHKTS